MSASDAESLTSGVAVVADHFVSSATQTFAHVETHLAKTDESELHGRSPSLLEPGPTRSRSVDAVTRNQTCFM